MTDARPPSRHATVYGSPGEMARVTGLVKTLWPVLLTMAAAGYLLRAAFPVPPITAPAAGALCLVLVVAAALLASYIDRRFSAYLKGARGEERVAHALGFLSADFVVFNGLSRGAGPFPGGEDFDHIVVGPRDVFVIETKNWAKPVTIRDGRILYGGTEPSRSPLGQVRRASDLLVQRLSEAGLDGIPVRPVLCFAETVLVEGPSRVSGVAVCTVRDLAGVLQEPVTETALATHARQGVVDFLRRQAADDGAATTL